MAKKQSNKPALRLEWIEAGTLTENPANWRRHPEGQVKALRGLINDPDIGWAGACLYNERTARLIDGHARRAAVSPDTPIPVLVGDWSEAAERKILATLDPIAAMATPDAAALKALTDTLDLDTEDLKAVDAHLAALMVDLPELMPEFTPAGPDAQGRLDEKAPTVCPNCGHEFHPKS